jgi:hypothetical protein
VLTCIVTDLYKGDTSGIYWSTTYQTAGAKTVTVKIDGRDADPVTANNTDVLTTPAASVDLAVASARDDSGGGAAFLTTHSQSATVLNYGPDRSRTAVVTITASAGQELSATDTSTYTCRVNTAKTLLTCAFSVLAPNTSTPVYWNTRYTTPTAKTVTVKVDAKETDRSTGNDSQVIKTPAPSSDVAISGVSAGGPTTGTLGETRTQSASLLNLGPDQANASIVEITASAGQDISPEGAWAFYCQRGDAPVDLSCQVPELYVRQPVLFEWKNQYSSVGSMSVSVRVKVKQPDPVAANNTKTLPVVNVAFPSGSLP